MSQAFTKYIRQSIAIIAALAALALTARQPAFAAPVSYTTGTYSQDFQSFSTTTGSTSINQSQMYEVSGLSGGGSVNGWYVYNEAGWASGFRWFAADGGSSSTGGFRTLYSSSNGNLALRALADPSRSERKRGGSEARKQAVVAPAGFPSRPRPPLGQEYADWGCAPALGITASLQIPKFFSPIGTGIASCVPAVAKPPGR